MTSKLSLVCAFWVNFSHITLSAFFTAFGAFLGGWQNAGVLCILTSEWVVRTSFDGQNQFFDTKTIFSVNFRQKM